MEYVESLSWIAEKTGVVGLILIGFSLAGLAIIFAKTFQFVRAGVRARSPIVEDAIEAIHAGNPREALSRLEGVRSPVARVLEAVARGLDDPGLREDHLREEVSRVGMRNLAQLESKLRGLDVIATLAPLLGLLGTVLGMIKAFARIEAAGSHVDPAVLSGGIWEALLTTAMGLAVAVPASAALSWFDSGVDHARRDMSDAVTRALATSRLRRAESQDEADEPLASGGGRARAV